MIVELHDNAWADYQQCTLVVGERPNHLMLSWDRSGQFVMTWHAWPRSAEADDLIALFAETQCDPRFVYDRATWPARVAAIAKEADDYVSFMIDAIEAARPVEIIQRGRSSRG